MSQPLFGCTLSKALRGDKYAKKVLLARLTQPAFTFMPCKHDPICPQPTREETAEFLNNLKEENPKALAALVALGGEPKK